MAYTCVLHKAVAMLRADSLTFTLLATYADTAGKVERGTDNQNNINQS